MRQFLPLTVLGVLLAAAATAGLVASESSAHHGSLTDHEFAVAVEIARTETTKQIYDDASISIATARAFDGTRSQSNTGHECLSGRLLQIELVGDFPHIVTTGEPVDPRDPGPPPDFTVHAVVVTADPETKQVCLIGVQVGEIRPPKPGDAILFNE
jgi:hypothetical protein